MKDKVLTKKAREHIQFFVVNERKLVIRIFDLFDVFAKTPFSGIGKPEALKGDLKGYWSRRVNEKHRLLYEVREDNVIIISCRTHYQ